jgi:tol-pal system protein YbgF
MARRSGLTLALPLLGFLGGAVACATTPPPAPAAPRPEDDVVALKERVNRLERRLADVDAKLGLLLAQRAPPRGGAPTSITRGALPELGPRDLIVDEPTDEASLGGRTRTIELGSRRSPWDVESDATDADRYDRVERSRRDDNEGQVIRLHGSSAPAPEPAEVGPPADATVQEAYAWAHARLKEGRHLEAIAALEDILRRHPGHDLADNSMYWIGWAHAQRSDDQMAVDVWRRLPMRFPKSPKVPDALFGMAVSHESLGEPAVAETLYEQLVSQYPRAEKAKDAKKALQRLRPR